MGLADAVAPALGVADEVVEAVTLGVGVAVKTREGVDEGVAAWDELGVGAALAVDDALKDVPCDDVDVTVAAWLWLDVRNCEVD